MQKIIIWGGGGHLKVINPILTSSRITIAAVIDQDPSVFPSITRCPVFRSLAEYISSEVSSAMVEPYFFALAIGGSKGDQRLEIHSEMIALGLAPKSLTHPTSWVAETAVLYEGVQVLAMAAVSEEAHIGEQTIINTNASIDHECIIGRGVHIMPGATLAGCCIIGDCVTIGSNATVLPRIKIGYGTVIGAGAVVTKDIPSHCVAVGIPARIIKYLEHENHE